MYSRVRPRPIAAALGLVLATAAAEDAAKAAGVGMWQGAFVPPWEHRHAKSR